MHHPWCFSVLPEGEDDEAGDDENCSEHSEDEVAGFFPARIVKHFGRLERKQKKKGDFLNFFLTSKGQKLSTYTWAAQISKKYYFCWCKAVQLFYQRKDIWKKMAEWIVILLSNS